MSDMERFLKLCRVLYYLKSLDEEIYVECEDAEEILNLITPLIPYDKSKKFILRFNISLTSDEIFNLLNDVWDAVSNEMLKISSRSERDYLRIKSLYLLWMRVRELSDAGELDDLKDEIINLYDLLDNYNQRVFYYHLESKNLLKEMDEMDAGYYQQLREIFNLMSDNISDELKRCGCDLSD